MELIVEEPDRFILRRRQGRSTAFLFGAGALYAIFGIFSALAGEPAQALLGAAVALPLLGAGFWQRSRRDEIAIHEGKLDIRRWVGPVAIGHDVVDGRTLALVDRESRPDAMFAVVAMSGPGYLEARTADKPGAAIARGLRFTNEELRDLQKRLSAALQKQR